MNSRPAKTEWSSKSARRARVPWRTFQAGAEKQSSREGCVAHVAGSPGLFAVVRLDAFAKFSRLGALEAAEVEAVVGAGSGAVPQRRAVVVEEIRAKLAAQRAAPRVHVLLHHFERTCAGESK